jgi:hypothetical protein
MQQQMLQMMTQMMQQQMQHVMQQQSAPELPIQFLKPGTSPAGQQRMQHMQQMERSTSSDALHRVLGDASSDVSSPGAAGSMNCLIDQSTPPKTVGTSLALDTPEKSIEMTPAQQAEAFLGSLKGDHDPDTDPTKKAKAKGKAKAKAAGKAKAKGKAAPGIAKGAGTAKGKAAPGSAKGAGTGSLGVAKTGKCRTSIPGWSDKRRIKLFPKGCPKCAWKTAGCTPSCFKQRGQI